MMLWAGSFTEMNAAERANTTALIGDRKNGSVVTVRANFIVMRLIMAFAARIGRQEDEIYRKKKRGMRTP